MTLTHPDLTFSPLPELLDPASGALSHPRASLFSPDPFQLFVLPENLKVFGNHFLSSLPFPGTSSPVSLPCYGKALISLNLLFTLFSYPLFPFSILDQKGHFP